MSRTTSRWTRTYDDAGRVSRLVHPDGHLTVHVSYTADGRRWYYPARLSTSRPYAHLADAVSAEARAYSEAMKCARDALVPVEDPADAQRERVIAEMERIRAEERRCTAPKGPDVILPRWSPPASVLALCGVAGVAWLLVCAGIVGWAL